MPQNVPGAEYGDIATRPDVRYRVDSTLYPTAASLDGVMRDRSLSVVKRIGAFVVYENPATTAPDGARWSTCF